MVLSNVLCDLAWSDVHNRLVARFPDVSPADIADLVIRASQAVELFGVTGDEAIERGQQIAINMIRQRTGELQDSSRLDPERHDRRKQPQ